MMKETSRAFINSACQVKRLARSQETREEGSFSGQTLHRSFLRGVGGEGGINQRSGRGRAGRQCGGSWTGSKCFVKIENNSESLIGFHLSGHLKIDLCRPP